MKKNNKIPKKGEEIMGIKFVGIGDDFGGEKYINNADCNIIKPLNNSEKIHRYKTARHHQ